MRIALACLLAIVFCVFGCEKYDQAKEGVQKAKDFVGNAEKQITETKENAEKSLGKVLGGETDSPKKPEADGENDGDEKKE